MANLSTLYAEYGEKETHRTMRELTAKTGKSPTWLELMIALTEKHGPNHKLFKGRKP